jgi:hypothetical protein
MSIIVNTHIDPTKCLHYHFPPHTIVPLPFQQQIVEYLIKFEILT